MTRKATPHMIGAQPRRKGSSQFATKRNPNHSRDISTREIIEAANRVLRREWRVKS